MKKRFEYLDVLKAIAIIAVLLYHFGWMKNGYLGVDVFLVVNGFLLAGSFRELSLFRGGYRFLLKRVLRLYPLTLLASGVCLIWGFFWMLPYQYQDLAQSVIATDLFANNILMSIKSSDYWNVLNDYKPLMHTWYLGIVVQFYVFITLVLIVAKKIILTKKDITVYVVGFCFVLSLILYLLPNFTATQKFYYLPFRIFEFCAGSLTAYWLKDRRFSGFEKKTVVSIAAFILYLFLFCILFVNLEVISTQFKLLLTIVLTCCLIVVLPNVGVSFDKVISNRWLAMIGKASFSIYIWHQIVFAFCRYSFTSIFDVKVFIVTMIIIIVLSWLSYRYVEQWINSYLKRENGERNTLIGSICLAIILIGTSLYLNSCSGVIRNVPELDTYVGKTSDRMHIAYNEEGYLYDRNFTSEKKLHWVVVGDSYGRDFVNILREMGIEDRVEISYVKKFELDKPDNVERIKGCDLVFRTMTIKPTETAIDDFYKYLDSLSVDSSKVIIVGSKRFGHCLGQVYSKRNHEDYFSLTADIEDWYLTQNEELKIKCKGRYIDLITPVLVADHKVRVFTDNNKIISQDCEHLTKNGAMFYAELLRTKIEQEIQRQTRTN